MNNLRAAAFNRAKLSGLRRLLRALSMTRTWPVTITPPAPRTFSTQHRSVNGRNFGMVYRLLDAHDRGLPSGIKTIAFRPFHHGNKAAIQPPAYRHVFFIFEDR